MEKRRIEEEALPRLKEAVQSKDRRCDGMRKRERRGEIVEFLEKVKQSGKWPQQACTSMFSLIPKNVASERPIALDADVDSLV